MSSINSVILTGNLTRDPDTKYNGAECERARFGLAVTRKSSKGETTTFVDCTAWKKTADIVARYCRKGNKVAVDGELKLDQWTAQDGSNRSKLTVTVRQIELLSAPPSDAPGHHDHYTPPPQTQQPLDPDNPF